MGQGNEYIKKQRLDHGDKDFKNTKYKWVQALETEAGHIFVLDDTPGAAKIFLASESGSYILMTTDGKVVNLTVGDRQDYTKGGITITVDENYDLKVHGHSRVVIGGGSYVEVAGDAGIGVGGDVTLVAKGNLNASVDNIYLGAKGDFNVNAKGNMNLKAGGTTHMQSSKDTYIKGANVRLNDPGDKGAGGTG